MTQQPQNGIQATNMTIFTWSITQLLTVPEPTPGYVFIANYVVIGIDGEYTASVENSAKFKVNSDQKEYTLYENLTEKQIIDWIQSVPNVIEDMQNCVQATINAQKEFIFYPTNTPLPWFKE